MAVGTKKYSRGGLYDLPLLISFLWLGTAGVIAYRNRGEEEKFPIGNATEAPAENNSSEETLWASRLARVALISLPIIGIWCMTVSAAPLAVREFRILVTLGAAIPLGLLAFLRQGRGSRIRLLRASQSHRQSPAPANAVVQSEKLTSSNRANSSAARLTKSTIHSRPSWDIRVSPAVLRQRHSVGRLQKSRDQPRHAELWSTICLASPQGTQRAALAA